MRHTFRIFLICLAMGFVPASAARAGYSAIAVLKLNGAVGNPILNGQSVNTTYTTFAYGYNTSQAGDLINGSPSYLEFLLVPTGGQPFALLTFGSNELGTPLSPGTYNNAERAAFAAPGFAGLDVGYNGAGSNMLTGSFTINTLTYFNDPGNNNTLEVAMFSANFTQYTDGNTSPLTGSLVYQNLASVPEPTSLALVAIGLTALGVRSTRRKSAPR